MVCYSLVFRYNEYLNPSKAYKKGLVNMYKRQGYNISRKDESFFLKHFSFLIITHEVVLLCIILAASPLASRGFTPRGDKKN